MNIETTEARRIQFLKSKVSDFIAHKKKIFNNSKANEPLHVAQFNKAIDVLNRELEMASDSQLVGYSNVVLRNIDNFKALLPHPNNDSYSSSLNCLDIMVGLCLIIKMEAHG